MSMQWVKNSYVIVSNNRKLNQMLLFIGCKECEWYIFVLSAVCQLLRQGRVTSKSKPWEMSSFQNRDSHNSSGWQVTCALFPSKLPEWKIKELFTWIIDTCLIPAIKRLRSKLKHKMKCYMSLSAIQIHVDFINIEQGLLYLHTAGKKRHSVLKILLLLVSEIFNTVCQKPSQDLFLFVKKKL